VKLYNLKHFSYYYYIIFIMPKGSIYNKKYLSYLTLRFFYADQMAQPICTHAISNDAVF
jgi:hypothetical protein